MSLSIRPVASRWLLRTLAAQAILFYSASAFAHEIRTAYLEIREERPGEFSVLWKTPTLGIGRLALDPEFSGDAKEVTPVTTRTPPGASIQQWTLHAPTLRGQTLHIRGLEGSMTDALVRIEFADGTKWVQRLTGDEPEATIPMRQSGWSVAGVYLKLGVDHILTGVDHLLFVLALIIITGGGWMLVKTVTAFTVSHSITLTAATVGFVHVPQRPVEAVIALSIVFMAWLPRPAGIDRALAVGRSAHVRAVARTRICGSAERSRVACGTNSAGATIFQRRRRSGPTAIHRGRAGWCCTRPPQSGCIPALDGARTTLRDR